MLDSKITNFLGLAELKPYGELYLFFENVMMKIID